MKPIIEVNHIWKEYKKGMDRRYKSLRDTIVDIPGRFFGERKEKFWALENIDFKVNAGESIGIIGRNGAGKSTLLKILSRITPPTKGEIILRGRVASLLEVGTGFHPELTGRENIFFNGSILGMKNQEIKKKFDEIVDFSGVESFIDTPLKHYSSGMQMRLAFSVAAHLDNEILLIDEVLAVGDAEFQKKCIGKMDEVSQGEGRTILFVSHDMISIQNLCTKGLLIADGHIQIISHIEKVILTYVLANNQYVEIIPDDILRNGDGRLRFTKIEVKNLNELAPNIIKSGDNVSIKVDFETFLLKDHDIFFAIGIENALGLRIGVLSNELIKKKLLNNGKNGYFKSEILNLPLASGYYKITLYCSINGIIADWIKEVFSFEVTGGDYYRTGKEITNYSGNVFFNYKMDQF